MNTKTIMFCFFTVMVIASTALGKIGCMEFSKHLKEAVDTKTLHYVQCNCPCEKKYQTVKGYCLGCEHFSVPKREEIIEVKVKKES